MGFAYLPERGVVAVRGADAVPFLQGLVSNDVAGIAPGEARFAALLTPQGKWLADFFVLAAADGLLLECERGQAPMLVRLLSRYRLRAKVALEDASAAYAVHAAWGEGAGDAEGPPGAPAAGAPGLAVRDPRHPAAGWRLLLPAPAAPDGTEAYDLHRLSLGLPDGSRDLEAGKSVLLEAGFDELHGVSWTKGCYMGQELTARTKYRGLLKRRLVPVAVSGPLPPRGAPVLLDGAEAGEMRSGRDGLGIALLRLEAARAPALACGEAVLTPRIPDWMRLPDA
ncbi:MAG: folate-binding protein [Acetobacteraceae bacterium]|nr:folate-binding protein [Acetobacteraceae bacterium]